MSRRAKRSDPFDAEISRYTNKCVVIIVPEPKRVANLEKHGIDLARFEAEFSWDRYLAVSTRPSRTGRARDRYLGTMGGRVVVAIVSPLGSEALAIISIRPAGTRERRPMTSKVDWSKAASLPADELDRALEEDLDEVDDNPEMTEADLVALEPGRRRPGQRGPGRRPAKVLLALRVDPAALEAWRATGPGWQRRIGDLLLREAPRRDVA